MTKYYRNSIIVFVLTLLAVPAFTVRVGAKASKNVSEGSSVSLTLDRAIDFSGDLSDQPGHKGKKYEMDEAESKLVRNTLEKVPSLDTARREMTYQLIKKYYRYLALRKAMGSSISSSSIVKSPEPPAIKKVASLTGGACANFLNELFQVYNLIDSCSACYPSPQGCIDCARLGGAIIELVYSYIECAMELSS